MAPQTIAGRYQVERAVGRGGMGTVWLCHDEILGREVAVKQVGTLPGETTPDLARALREARTSAALNHRNVISIYDAVEDGDDIWLVMEYLPSRTLSQLLADEGPLPPERAAWIGAQVADGLAAAHARGTIHRDVKPGNVLVTDDDLAKISDFGIARTRGEAQLTQVGMVIGTPAYFSPELARGGEPSPAGDVWALGASLYAAVEGRSPYPEQLNPIATLTAIATGQPPRPEHAGLLSEPITRMLDPDPSSRWSMADVAHVLHRLHDQHDPAVIRAGTTAFAAPEAPSPVPKPAPAAPRPAVEGPPVTTPPGGAKRERRGVRLWALAVLALLAVLAVVSFVALDGPGDDPSALPPDVAEESSQSTDDPAADPTESEPEPQQEPDPEQQPEQQPEPDPEQQPEPDPEQQPDPAPGVAADSEQFVLDYYDALPDDTRSGWSKLSPQFQAEVGSYPRYRGFWSGFSSVEATGASEVEAGAVDVALTYTGNDGTVEDEVRRIHLEPANNGYLIVGDEIVS